jgi:hypothetical protein
MDYKHMELVILVAISLSFILITRRLATIEVLLATLNVQSHSDELPHQTTGADGDKPAPIHDQPDID